MRLNNCNAHDIFEHSIISRFNFTNGVVKKIDRCIESQVDQVIIGYDFFKTSCEANTKDLSLPPLPFATIDKIITHTKIMQSVKPSTEIEIKNNEVDSTIGNEPPNDEMDD